MALPPGVWSLKLVGQYLRADGTPHRGFVTMTPEPVSVTATPGGNPVTITLQAARFDICPEGYICGELLNPNDPFITPGTATGNPWMYCVRETFERGPVIGWRLKVPEDVTDGGVVDLASVQRLGEDIYRPADWFPHHLIDTPVQASRISPRSGPLMRKVP